MNLNDDVLKKMFDDGFTVVSSHSDGSEHFFVLQKEGSRPFIVRALGHELSNSLNEDYHGGISNLTFTMMSSR